MMTVLAFSAFAHGPIDVAVVEVGLGGRLDATNVLCPLVSIITGIGLDHQAYLGSTLADIAWEKGGIIKPGVPVVIGQVDGESQQILCGLARRAGSVAHIFGRNFTICEEMNETVTYQGLVWRLANLRLGLCGHFQRRNAAVALAALELLRPSFSVAEADLRQGLRTVTWPGRLDMVSEHPLVILDGAHNPQAIETLITELPGVLQGRRMKLLFAVMRDKDWRTMVPSLAQIADEVVVTRVQQARAEDPAILRTAFAPFCPVSVIPDAREACRRLVTEAGPSDAVVVCGSLFLVGEVYPLFAPVVSPSLQQAQKEKG
jgi:dihydrofolate synthase/folylpolyglutamate synthase